MPSADPLGMPPVGVPASGADPLARPARLAFGHAEAFKVLLGYLAGQIAALFVAGFILSAAVALLHPADAAARKAAHGAAAPYVVLLSALGGAAGGLGLSHHYIRARAGQTFRAAVAWSAGTARQWAGASAAGVALALAYFVLSEWLWPLETGGPMGPLGEMGRTPGASRIVWTVLALAIAPPLEEFLFRGVFFTGCARRWGVPAAAVGSTAAFALIHVPEASYYWPALGTIAALGGLTVALRIRTGSVGPAVAAHLAYNALVVAAAYLAF